METNAALNGGFWMLTEEISFESIEDNPNVDAGKKVVNLDDEFFPDTSF